MEMKDHTKDYILWHIPLLIIPIVICSGAIFWSLNMLESQGFESWAEGRLSGLMLFISSAVAIICSLFSIIKNLFKFARYKKLHSST